MSDLLFEIGSEEIPASFLLPAAAQLEQLFTAKMAALGLSFGTVSRFATPRRLALAVTAVDERQPDSEEVLLGPSKQAAFDGEGRPTRAAEGFARSRGASVEDLVLVQTPKGEYLQLTRTVVGRPTAEILPGLLKEMILGLHFPKSMKWGANQHAFVRPIQWIVALFGGRVIEFEHEGIVAGARTRGHRFMAPDFVEVDGAASYERTLESLQVIADFDKRRARVVEEIRAAVAGADFGAPAEVAIDEGLLDTITNLVEYPFGVCGRFDDKFLPLISQVLVTSMREHQKYFPVVGRDGALLPGFVAVNNTRVVKPELTREGHQRVLRARLEDALFFFQSDRRRRLEDRVADLGGVIFQARLGTVLEKSERIVKLTGLLAGMFAPDLGALACRAALLCKADLTTAMVGEFPSLQGEMGSAYAAHDGEDEEVAAAIREHYLPLRSGSALPQSTAGALVGLADRIDTIAGCFGIGQTATGTADPFGLRRLTLALLHLVQDRGWALELPATFAKALALYGERVNGGAATVAQIVEFVKGRFVNDCVRRGMEASAVEAVVSVQFVEVNDCLRRIEAFEAIRTDQSFDLLAGSFKRIRNIVKDNDDSTVDPGLFQGEAERELHRIGTELAESGREKLREGNYRDYLGAMLGLKDPVDRFFDEVMVMADDQALRTNRLNLLTGLNRLILEVGDISRMHRG